MHTQSRQAIFTGIGYGILGDILGRPYEAAFFFLRTNFEKPAVKDNHDKLISALRNCYPFEKLEQAWNSITGSNELWESLQRFLRLNAPHEFSDDTVLTVATIDALGTKSEEDPPFAQKYHAWGNKYPKTGYGPGFKKWLKAAGPTDPYGATTNGSAMRVAPIGYLDISLDRALALAEQSAEVTHSSSEAIHGAKIVVETVHVYKNSRIPLCQIAQRMLLKHFDEKNLKPQAQPTDRFEFECLHSVKHCLQILSRRYENFDALMKRIVNLGGDTDTFGMICGSAWGATCPSRVLPSELFMNLKHGLDHDLFEVAFH